MFHKERIKPLAEKEIGSYRFRAKLHCSPNIQHQADPDVGGKKLTFLSDQIKNPGTGE